ncbi:MAG: hypothetical protein EOP62_11865 [Sphingomonadales bacterium]|nr:MAG: hypothetical protein EOP62_11865 [Sphingomonadales bacterium]
MAVLAREEPRPMAMPNKMELTLPLLKLVSERQISIQEATTRLAKMFNLSASEQAEMLASGKGRFYDRVGWARVYLRQAGLVDLPRRGHLRITKQGKGLLAEGPQRIDMRTLQRFPEFRAFMDRSAKTGRYVSSRIGVVTVPDPEQQRASDADVVATEATLHTEIQYRLLKLGADLGLSTWVARNDRSRSFGRERFANMPNLVSELPLQFDMVTNRIIELIDVLWLDGRSIAAAFEIESTTSIYSGLLRMSDLAAMQPNIKIRLFLVAPEARRAKVMQEINRPTFSRFSPAVNEICRYISFERLSEEIERATPHIRHLKPSFIEEIAESCAFDADSES